MSRETVIRRIIKREVQKRGLTERTVRCDAPALYRSACKYFGTWDTALKYAGVGVRRLYIKESYTREYVIERLREYCARGFKPKAVAVMCHDHRLYDAARRHFGTWKNAVRAAIDPHASKQSTRKPIQLNKQQILDAIRAWNGAGRSICWSKIIRENRPLAMAAQKAFGTWRRALIMAGITDNMPPSSRRKCKWSRERIIEQIRCRHQEGKPMNFSAVQKDQGSLLWAGLRLFGSWNNALAAAGVRPYSPERNPRPR
jgi:hypothetical protein